MITVSDFDRDPKAQFLSWYNEAIHSKIKNPEAMTLATASVSGIPSARIVLFKGFNSKGLRFFTNYLSRKGNELDSNPNVALVFYWSQLDRQIRVEGKIEKLSPSESDEYWHSRPRGSRIGAIASPQSSIIESREILEKRVDELNTEFDSKEIPRPENWGGYCVIPSRFEFWFAGDDRLHDRICYIRKENQWKIVRLAP